MCLDVPRCAWVSLVTMRLEVLGVDIGRPSIIASLVGMRDPR